MKKLVMLFAVCFMVTGCGAKSGTAVQAETHEKKDVVETVKEVEDTVKETEKETTAPEEVRTEDVFAVDELVSRIHNSFNEIPEDIISRACKEDLDAVVLYYYDALKTGDNAKFSEEMVKLCAGYGFEDNQLVTNDISYITANVSILDNAEESHLAKKKEFIDELSNRIYATMRYHYGESKEDKAAIQFLCENNLDEAIAYYYEFLTYAYNSFDGRDVIRIAIANAADGKITHYDPDMSCVQMVKENISILDEYEENYRNYVDGVFAKIAADKESRAAREKELADLVANEGLQIEWKESNFNADGMDFQYSGVSSAWYGVELREGRGNDERLYYKGLFNNKNDDSKHLYVEWSLKDQDTYQVEVPYSTIDECSNYFKY